METRHLSAMLDFVRQFIDARAAVRRDADELLALHGDRAWVEARLRAHNAMDRGDPLGDDAQHAWSVAYLIQRRLKIYHQPDTATRYVEDSQWMRRSVRPMMPVSKSAAAPGSDTTVWTRDRDRDRNEVVMQSWSATESCMESVPSPSDSGQAKLKRGRT